MLDVLGRVRGGELVVMPTVTWDHLRLWHSGSIAYIHAGGVTGLSFRIENTGTSTFPVASYTEAMRITSAGNVSIGTSSSSYKLEVSQGTTGTTGATVFPLKISVGAYTDGGNNTSTLIALGTQYGTYSKCAIGHCRTGSWDRGSIVFLCNNTLTSQMYL